MRTDTIAIFAALALAACTEAAPPAPASGGTDVAQEEEVAELSVPDTNPQTAETPAQPQPEILAPLPAPAVPAPQPVAAPVQAAPAQQDSRLVGIWVNETNINSGGGNFASYSTVMTMELHPDGRVVQYTESVGGGGDWSYDGGKTIDFDGQWRADGQTLYVYAAPLPDFTPAATYSFSGEYLVTQSDMGRLIWQRRG